MGMFTEGHIYLMQVAAIARDDEIKFRKNHNASGVVNIMEVDPTKWDDDDHADVETRVRQLIAATDELNGIPSRIREELVEYGFVEARTKVEE